MKISFSGSSSISLLVRLISAHIFGTLFAYIVYVRFTQLGDRYESNNIARLLEATDGEGFTSTVFTLYVYTYMGLVLPGFLSAMLLSVFVAIFTWLAFKDVYTHLSRKLFWTCNLFPHFLIWSGAASKEQLVILSGMVIINFAAKRSFAAKNLSISLIFVFLAMAVIVLIRPNYFVMYFIIFITALFSPWLHKIISNRLSVGIWVFIFGLSTFGLVTHLALTSKFFSEDVIDFMLRVENSFLAYTDAGSNRLDIQWNNIGDFFYNTFWGIPQGFIGPTLFEAISKPVQFPAFLEGLLYLITLGYLFYKLVQLSIKSRNLRIHILPYIFVCFSIIFVSYPYLIFNPGSALRYRQSMHPILIFYPLLILAYYRANHLMMTALKKTSDKCQ